MGGNSIVMGQKGVTNVRFADGTHYRYCLPTYKLGGTVYGERSIEGHTNMYFEDITNNRCGWVIVNTHKVHGYLFKSETGRKDEIIGIIYDPTDGTCTSDKKFLSKSGLTFKDINDITNVQTKLVDIAGSWLSSLEIDGETVWDINRHIPHRFTPVMENVAPSDSRYRDDMLWLRRGYQGIAHQWKVKMEQQQRHDRKLR